MNNKLNTKDLINVGIFTAIYTVIFFTVSMIGLIPVFMLLLPFLIPFVGGIPFMLYLTKVNKFGMVTITGILVSIILFASGQAWPVLVITVPSALIADLIFKSGGYKNWRKTHLGFCIFSLWIIGSLLPLWIMRDSYIELGRAGYGDTYVDTLISLTPVWVLPILVVLTVIGATAGAYLGRRVLRKHFIRAGIV